MDVKMGHRLGDDVVHRDERALCAHRVPYGRRQPLCLGKERLDQFGRQIRQRLVVGARHEERVAVEHGARVEEGDAGFVFEHQVRRLVTGDDAAKEAVGRLRQ